MKKGHGSRFGSRGPVEVPGLTAQTWTSLGLGAPRRLPNDGMCVWTCVPAAYALPAQLHAQLATSIGACGAACMPKPTSEEAISYVIVVTIGDHLQLLLARATVWPAVCFESNGSFRVMQLNYRTSYASVIKASNAGPYFSHFAGPNPGTALSAASLVGRRTAIVARVASVAMV